jgi:hypothetical protein
MAPRDLDDDERTTAEAVVGSSLDAAGYWATAEERDGDTYVIDVVLEGDAADVVAALQAFDRDADDPVAALRAAYADRAAAAAADLAEADGASSPGTSFESNFDEMQAANESAYKDADVGLADHVDVDVDVDQDLDVDMTANQSIGT